MFARKRVRYRNHSLTPGRLPAAGNLKNDSQAKEAMPSERLPWKIAASRYVVESHHLRLRCDDIELPDGTFIEEYYVRESRGFSIAFALTPEEHVVLVRQYKHGVGREVLELPAGGIDPGEDPRDCARRELAEETGYVGDPAEPEHLGSFVSDPTGSNGRFHLYLFRNVRQLLPQHLDPTEEIAIELATIPELRRFVGDGTIDVGPNVAAIYFALDRLGRL